MKEKVNRNEGKTYTSYFPGGGSGRRGGGGGSVGENTWRKLLRE